MTAVGASVASLLIQRSTQSIYEDNPKNIG
jgi:hypothetical protein